MLLVIYLAFGVWAAGYLVGWLSKEANPGNISDWLMLVSISLLLGPIMLAGVYFTGMMDKHGWTLYLDNPK
jgi:uncharacterized membrane protein (DUF485 family)